jgi:tetratricopeptide (TPR) repeat protein
MKRLLLSILALAWAAPLVAQTSTPTTPAAKTAPKPPPFKSAEQILLEASSPAELRDLLLENARKQERADRNGAGESHYYRGVSFERAGAIDSAIAEYRQALALRGMHEDRLALVDVLLRRRDPASVAEAVRMLETSRLGANTEEGMLIAYDARLGWALTLAGHADSSDAYYRPFEWQLTSHPEWRYRMARAALALGDDVRAFKLLRPLAIKSREQDEEVMKDLRGIAERMRFEARLDGELLKDIGGGDLIEKQAMRRMNALRVTFSGRDGFRLGGVFMSPPSPGPFRPVVVLVAPGDTIADYDSLGVALVGASLAPLFLDPRGSGWSLTPACPSPDTWTGREEQLHRLVARDVRAAVSEIARLCPTDTTHYVICAVGATASMAVEAADFDRRVAALVLVSPKPEAVERGPMRARLAKLQIPVFYQLGPLDTPDAKITDAFYQAGNRPLSRIAEARKVGGGPLQFHHDPAIAARLTKWLVESLAPLGRIGTRPGRPPGG